MGGVLTVSNDRLHDFEILRASIFTAGQGICLQRLEPGKSSVFKFDHNLAYGSWYDIQIIGRSLNGDPTHKIYLKKGIYLSHGKIVPMTELIGENHLDHGVEWICSSCKEINVGSVVICEHFYINKS